jgi:thioredoxin 1
MSEINLKTKEDFDKEVLKSEIPALVDFWASWCTPCQTIAPILEELAEEYEDRVKICKANIDEARELTSEYEVMSIPNLIFFKGGQKVDQIIGAVEKEKIKKVIEGKLL